MCGIFGFTKGAKFNLDEARESLNTLYHRGPDQWGEYSDNDVYLGFRRLAIMDLSERGKQPMQSKNIVLTVNGEVYNFSKLRAELEKDFQFKSNSDSEVILHGYEKWGIDTLVKKIDGMYAFCIYDSQKKKIYLVRDRVGIKPLYYSEIDGEFTWASELKAIESYHKKRDIDNTAIYDFLTYGYVPTPKTMYKNIYKLEPGCYLEIDLETKTLKKQQYWKLLSKEIKISKNEARIKVKQLLENAIKDQMVADVEVGFFLSGGLDSSTVVGIASTLSDKINTYSIGFDVKEHDETHFAKKVAEYFKTKHKSSEVNLDSVVKDFNKLKDWYDEPFADTSAFPSFQVSKLARKECTVVLTGDGGDEVFGGYKWYTKFLELKPSSSFLTRIFSSKITEDQELELYAQILGDVGKEKKKLYREILNIEDSYDDYWYFRKFYRKDLPIFKRLRYLDFNTYLPDDILTKVDRVSMAVSLEARVPLLDTDLVEFMFSLPDEVVVENGNLKSLMKLTIKDILPDEIINRDKKGFSIPLAKWGSGLMGEFSSKQEKILSELFNIKLINPRDVKVYIRHCEERTLPILQEYFKDMNVELINGRNRKFGDVFFENLKLIQEQEEPYAIVADGDLIPLVPLNTVLEQLIRPLLNKESYTVNGTRIDKFFNYPNIATGGFKSYTKKHITKYIESFDKTQLKPEGYLFRKIGNHKQISIKYPLVGHEYGQYLWHIYEKAYQREGKSTELPKFRDNTNNIEQKVFARGISDASKNNEAYASKEYSEESLPEIFRDKEKNEINDVNLEFQNLIHEVKIDLEKDNMPKINNLLQNINEK